MELTPGTYEFYLTPSLVSRNAIMIYSVDNGRWIGMTQGINDGRMDASKMSGFTFIGRGEGVPKALEYWFYPGWNRGIKFIYAGTLSSGTLTATIVPYRR